MRIDVLDPDDFELDFFVTEEALTTLGDIWRGFSEMGRIKALVYVSFSSV